MDSKPRRTIPRIALMLAVVLIGGAVYVPPTAG